MTNRRSFLKQAGILAAGLPLAAGVNLPALAGHLQEQSQPLPKGKWAQLRQLFNQDPDYLHFANFLVTSHPTPVRNAIDLHRANIDRNPGRAMDWDLQETEKREHNVRVWAGRYLIAKPEQIALTGSTTEGLAMIYGGIHVRPDQEILVSEHEHYSTHYTLNFVSSARAPRCASSSCSTTAATFPWMKCWIRLPKASARRLAYWA